jgi:hypothetical protein
MGGVGVDNFGFPHAGWPDIAIAKSIEIRSATIILETESQSAFPPGPREEPKISQSWQHKYIQAVQDHSMAGVAGNQQ